MSAKDYVYQPATVLMILERHRNKGTTSRQVKQAIWQAEQAIRAVTIVWPYINTLDTEPDAKFLAARDAIHAMNSVMPETTKGDAT